MKQTIVLKDEVKNNIEICRYCDTIITDGQCYCQRSMIETGGFETLELKDGEIAITKTLEGNINDIVEDRTLEHDTYIDRNKYATLTTNKTSNIDIEPVGISELNRDFEKTSISTDESTGHSTLGDNLGKKCWKCGNFYFNDVCHCSIAATAVYDGFINVGTTTGIEKCNHLVDVKLVAGKLVSVCTICGKILDTKTIM